MTDLGSFNSAGSLPAVIKVSMPALTADIPLDADVLILEGGVAPSDKDVREMQEVLHSCERHGLVCARTTEGGTWTSFPLESGDEASACEDVVSSMHAELSSMLDRYYVVPSAPGWPVLVRGSLLRRFDAQDACAEGPVAISLRLSRYGYSTLVANRVLLKPGGENQALSVEQVLSDSSFPHSELKSGLEYFLSREISPLECFADLYQKKPRKPRLLYSLYALAPVFNGVAEHGLALLRELHAQVGDRYEITVYAPQKAAEFHDLRSKYPSVVYPGEPLGVFDIGFSPSQVMQRDHLAILDRHCLRIVFSLLDLIKVRTLALRSSLGLDALRLSVTLADGIIANSRAVAADAKAYFGPLFNRSDQQVWPIHCGMDIDRSPVHSGSGILDSGFILLVGNAYFHKAVGEAVDALAPIFSNIVVMGDSSLGALPEGVKHFPSGALPDNVVDSLYRRCAMLVFPSQYEGFGLPLARALCLDKPVVLFETETNKEVVAAYALRSDQACFCRTFDEIPEIVERVFSMEKNHESSPCAPRSWSESAAEHVEFLEKVLHQPVLTERLVQRREMCQLFVKAWAEPDSLQGLQRGSCAIAFAGRLMSYFVRRTSSIYESIANWLRRSISRGGRSLTGKGAA